ncbi:unnamed protein product [Timema podura]|uniref:Arginase n=1 Tax=Timema podura TaxID=61482 RepID=A0ABN7NV62_TIMPD|nr:unnamed protein product [Timema podura]
MIFNRALIYFNSSFEATFSKSKIVKRAFHGELFSRNHADRKYGIVGVPFGKGQLKSGVGNAPEAIRSQKLLTDLHRMGYDVKDYGDDNVSSG